MLSTVYLLPLSSRGIKPRRWFGSESGLKQVGGTDLPRNLDWTWFIMSPLCTVQPWRLLFENRFTTSKNFKKTWNIYFHLGTSLRHRFETDSGAHPASCPMVTGGADHSSTSSKIKVKLPLCFKWAPRHEGVLGERRYSSTHSWTSTLDGGEWSASRPGRFTPRERAPGTHWIGGWVGPRAVLDAVAKRKIPSPPGI
jgi:hypothetical protein